MKSYIYTFIGMFTIFLMPMLSIAATSLNDPFTVSVIKKITSADLEPFGFTLINGDEFGGAVANLKNIDEEGGKEVAVGAFERDGTGTVLIVSINGKGVVKNVREIANNSGGFEGVIPDGASFGHSVTFAHDINGDDKTDLIVGAPDQIDSDGSSSAPGKVHVLFLNGKAKVKGEVVLGGSDQNSIDDDFVDLDEFGHTVSLINDRVGEFRRLYGIGVPGDDDGGSSTGTVYINAINKDGKVETFQKINGKQLGFDSKSTQKNDRFGDAGIVSISDLDGDDTPELAIGASGSDLGSGPNEGAFWITFLNENATVKKFTEISRTSQPVLAGLTEPGDFFGHGTLPVGEYDNGVIIAAGAFGDDDGATNAGALWIVWVNNDGNVERVEKISNNNPDFGPRLIAQDWFGFAAALIKQENDSAVIAVGAPNSLADNTAPGDLWIVELDFN